MSGTPSGGVSYPEKMPTTRVAVNSLGESIEVCSWRRELAAGHAGKQAAVGQLEQTDAVAARRP